MHDLVYRIFMILALTTLGLQQSALARFIYLRLKPAPFEVQQEVGAVPPKLSGFIAIYGGYVDYSSPDEFKFPLLHKERKIYMVVTPEIQLTTVFGKTISHKNFVPGAPTEIYLFEKKKNADNKTIYWQVRKEEKPEHSRISPISIVLLTNPKNIVVATGDHITPKSQNFVLPNVYVVGNDNMKVNLNFLDIKRFFEPIERSEKIDKATVQQIITNR